MQKSGFRDLSGSYKLLTMAEFALYFCVLFFSVTFFSRSEAFAQQPIEATGLAIYSILLSLLVLLTSLSLGLYNPRARDPFHHTVSRIALAWSLGIVEFTVLVSIFISPYPFSHQITLSVLAIGFVLASILRYLVSEKLNLLGLSRLRVLVIGAGERASIIEKRMRRKVDRHGFDIVGLVTMPGDATHYIKKHKKLSIAEGSLLSYVIDNRIDEIVVACDQRRNNLPVDELFACKVRGVNIIDILDFMERETGQIAVNLIYPSWIIYSNGFASTHHVRTALDWLFNATFALVLLTICWPLMLLTALAIKAEDGWKAPIIYSQNRVGLNGKIFRIFKFRSMKTDAESAGSPVWAAVNDDRTTKVGAFIRKYRLDELPQLYNVLRGDMGFVGPRPERPEFVQNLVREISYYNERHNVKPGLTGWAQLKHPYGSSIQDAEEKLKYDLYYLKHRSFYLDIKILLRTVEIVLFGKGR